MNNLPYNLSLMGFDIIGDIHGQYDKLVGLLLHLGYTRSASTWRCAGRSVVFVGDLIDRGPGQLETLELVRGMREAGDAQCILGNHEFNAVAWTIPDPRHPGDFLRSHRESGNRRHHKAFLERVEGTQKHADIIGWFRTLPLWLDLGGVRVVHACWHQPSMDVLLPLMGAGTTLTERLFLEGNTPGEPAHRALEIICKGPEVRLPDGMSYADSEGKRRNSVRVRWWSDDLSTFRKAAIGPPGDMNTIPDGPMPSDWRANAYQGPPVVFGHYWFHGTPAVISSQFACVDYSAARTGPLVAYRWDGEARLSSEKLTWAPVA